MASDRDRRAWKEVLIVALVFAVVMLVALVLIWRAFDVHPS